MIGSGHQSRYASVATQYTLPSLIIKASLEERLRIRNMESIDRIRIPTSLEIFKALFKSASLKPDNRESEDYSKWRLFEDAYRKAFGESQENIEGRTRRVEELTNLISKHNLSESEIEHCKRLKIFYETISDLGERDREAILHGGDPEYKVPRY